jgi:hypothetical protein
MLQKTYATLAAGCLALLLTAPGRAAGEDRGKSIEPFNGKDLTGWQFKKPVERSKWKVGRAELDPDQPNQLVVRPAEEGRGELVNSAARGVDAYTEQKFGDCTIEVVFLVPKGSNSGIYVQGEYEVQILDSFGKDKVGPGDVGGLYGAAAPRVNAARKPGEWQKFVIEFRAPRFEDGRKVANARFVKVALNGEVIHEDVEIKGPTPSGVTGKEAPTGPLMFQGDHGPVAYRNIRVTPRASD